MTTSAAAARPVRLCETCGQVDDHPRHVHGTADGASPVDPTLVATALKEHAGDDAAVAAILKQVQDTSTQTKHLDCCAADGCPDGSCNQIVAAAGDAKGAKLVKHLTSGAADKVGADLNERRVAAAQAANDQLPANVTEDLPPMTTTDDQKEG